MEEIQECAGNLKAELLDARDAYDHGRMTKEQFREVINRIREKREQAMAQWLSRHPRPAPSLPFVEVAAD